MIIQLGGMEAFAEEYLHWITRTAGKSYKIFPCAAVQVSPKKLSGTVVPNLLKPPVNVIEPLKWILEKIENRLIKTQILSEKESQNQLISHAIAEAKAIVARGATNLRYLQAQKILSDIPHELQTDNRINAARLEIKSARKDYEEQYASKQNRHWIIFGISMFILLPIVIIVFYKVFNQGK